MLLAHVLEPLHAFRPHPACSRRQGVGCCWHTRLSPSMHPGHTLPAANPGGLNFVVGRLKQVGSNMLLSHCLHSRVTLPAQRHR